MAILELTSVRCLMTADLLCRDGVRLRVVGDDQPGIEMGRVLEEGYARRLAVRVGFEEEATIELVDHGGGVGEALTRREPVAGAVDRLVLFSEGLAELPVGAHARVARFRGGSSIYRLDLVLHVQAADLQRWRGRPRMSSMAQAPAMG